MASTPEMAQHDAAKSNLWRRVKRVLRSIVLIYLLVCLVMYLLQTKLIFPGASTQGAPEAAIRTDPGEELVDLTAADGTPIKGLFLPAEGPARRRINGSTTSSTAPAEATPKPVVLYFYGNGQCMADCTYEADIFRQLGYAVMVVDYAGYGLSGGKPSEQGCYAAAEVAYQYLLTRPDVAQGKIVVAGWSLGGGVAVELAYAHRGDRTLAGLMTFSTFSSAVDLGQEQMPFLPVGLLLKHRFLSTDKLKHLTLPYFAGHGRYDQIVPFRNLDRVTAAYAGSPKNLTRFESSSDHNDFFDNSGDSLRTTLGEFLKRIAETP